MSGVAAAAYVMRLRLRTPAHKLVLLALATRCDQAYSCFPSRALIAGEALVSEERAKTLLRDLRREGYISARQRYRENGSKSTNRFYVHGPWDQWGGTGSPFREIDRYEQGEDRYAAIRDGEFIPRPRRHPTGTLGTSDPSPDTCGAGVAHDPCQGSPAHPWEGIAENPSRTDHDEPTTGADLPDVRRTAAGGYTGPPVAREQPARATGRRRKVKTKPRRRPDGFDAVAQALPEEVRPARPGVVLAPTLVRAICDALTGVPGQEPGTYRTPARTPEQLIARINRRWYRAGAPERAHPDYRGADRITRPVGYVAALLTVQECPDPACEDGVLLDTGAACRACAERRAEERQAEQACAAAAERMQHEQQALLDRERASVGDGRDAAAAEEQRVRRQLAAAGRWGQLLDHQVAAHMAAWRAAAAPDPSGSEPAG